MTCTQPAIADYALLGDMRTAALASREGSIDWLCVPRFDSPACFAAILGGKQHGRWLLAPVGSPAGTAPAGRWYRGDTLVLETEHDGPDGTVMVVDAMPPSTGGEVTVVRLVTGRSGLVPMRMEFMPRFGYGRYSPVIRRAGRDLLAVRGTDTLRLSAPVEFAVGDGTVDASFTVAGGQRVPFVLTWFPSGRPEPPHFDAEDLVAGCARAIRR
jgi:GH15 family glucan-1,4-alpha-glucosidase